MHAKTFIKLTPMMIELFVPNVLRTVIAVQMVCAKHVLMVITYKLLCILRKKLYVHHVLLKIVYIVIFKIVLYAVLDLVSIVITNVCHVNSIV